MFSLVFYVHFLYGRTHEGTFGKVYAWFVLFALPCNCTRDSGAAELGH